MLTYFSSIYNIATNPNHTIAKVRFCQQKHSGLTRGHKKNDKIQKNYYFHQIQSILTLWQKIDFLFFIYF